MFKSIKKFIKNPYTFSIISKLFVVVIGFLFTIFQSRYLGAEIKGQIATVNSLSSITYILCGFGMQHAYPYFKRKHGGENLVPVFMKVSILMSVVYLAIAVIGIVIFKPSEKIASVMLLTPLMTYTGNVSAITLIEVPNKRNLIDIIVSVLEMLFLLILWVCAPPSFLTGIFVIIIKDVFLAIIFTWWWRNKILIKSESVWTWIPKIVAFGFFPMLSILMTTLNYRVDVIMLDGKVSDAAIGVYSVGVLLAERVWMIPDAMKGVLQSNIAKGKGVEEVSNVIRISNTVCLFIVLGIALVGKPFLNIVFGSEFDGAYTVTLILLLGVFAMIYYKLIAAYNIVMGRQKINFVFLCIGVIINIVANLILIPIIGIYGAGIASVLSYAACSGLFIVYFCVTTKISILTMLFVNKEDISKIRKKMKSKKNIESKS